MVKHVVMWRLHDEAEGQDKHENARHFREKLKALPGHIGEIDSMEVGINTNHSDAAFDIVMISSFASQQDLENYQIHPEHEAVVEFAKKVVRERVVVDYWY